MRIFTRGFFGRGVVGVTVGVGDGLGDDDAATPGESVGVSRARTADSVGVGRATGVELVGRAVGRESDREYG
ncbi:hypothetical protein AB0K48_45040 [Nonomuraea sp. NPDC055795]